MEIGVEGWRHECKFWCEALCRALDSARHTLVAKARESAEVKTRFFEKNRETILQASLAMTRAFHHGRKLLVCGNGGGATDAEHIATEFMHPITVGRHALPAISLTNDAATMTAVANDVSFADVFSRQIIALGKAGDVALGVSTSGNSENLLRAFETAKLKPIDFLMSSRRRSKPISRVRKF